MPSVLTITLNPTVDKNYRVDRLEPDHKLHSPNPSVEAGGGGVNVAKAVHRLGGEVSALILAGGRNGGLLEELLQQQEIPAHTIPIAGETRESLTIAEASTGRQYRIVLDGPTVTDQQAGEVFDFIRAFRPVPDFIVASGSLPQGLPLDYYGQLAKRTKEAGIKFILDTSGEALREAAGSGVFLLKPNLRELAALSGRQDLELEHVDEAALQLIETGKCEVVVVSLGAGGAMLVTKDGYEHISAPTVKKQSTVGAGDSMVAGMVWALTQGMSYPDMARMGVACGTAATMQPGTQLFTKPDAFKLFEWLKQRRR